MLCVTPGSRCHHDSSTPPPGQPFPSSRARVRPIFHGKEPAPAVFVSRNEAFGFERKNVVRKNYGNAEMRNYGCDVPYSIPNSSNPNSRPGLGVEAVSNRAAVDETEDGSKPSLPRHHQRPARVGPDGDGSAAADCGSVGRKIVPFASADHYQPQAGCQVNHQPWLRTYNVAGYSRMDREMLLRRLSSELQTVRHVLDRVDSWDPSRAIVVASSSNRPPSPSPSPPVVRAPPPEPRPVTPDGKTDPPAPEEPKKVPDSTKTPRSPTKKSKKRAAAEKHLSNVMKRCAQILTRLMRAKDGHIFNTPVDVIGLRLHDYHHIIKKPMDLGTVNSRLSANLYASPSEFAEDVRLTFNNAVKYNPKGHYVNDLATQLLNMFESLFKPANQKYEKHLRAAARAQGTAGGKERRREGSCRLGNPKKKPRTASVVLPAKITVEPRASSTTPSPRPVLAPAAATLRPPHPQPQQQQPRGLSSPPQWCHRPLQPEPRCPPPTRPSLQPAAGPHHSVHRESSPPRSLLPKRVKLKSKDPVKREMSSGEMRKLIEGLQTLDTHSPALEIVKRRQPSALVVEGDQAELIFEALNNETLWELYSHIYGHNRVQQATKADKDQAPVENGRSPGGGSTTVTMELEDEEDVDIGEEMPPTHFPSVLIDPDGEDTMSSSSSSSGDSSSSSSSTESDSDSD